MNNLFKRIKNQLEEHQKLMIQFEKEGLSKEEASKKAYEKMLRGR